MTISPMSSQRLCDERGSALIIAMIAMSLMLMLGLATLSMTDTQTRQSGLERVRESSFNLAEGALQQQSFLLGGKGWPKLATDALPIECTLGSDPSLPQNARCPTPASLVTAAGTGAFDERDYKTGAVWTTRVRDNTAVNNQVYDATAVDARPRYDENGDGFIWVKSTATVGTKARSIVALLKRDPIPIFLPKAVLVSGALEIGQGGQPGVITTDTTTPPVVRCSAGPDCADYQPAKPKKDSQIVPDTVDYNPGYGNRVSDSTLQQLLDSGRTFTNSCPSEAELTGIVIIDLASDADQCPVYNGNVTVNSAASPGIVIMKRGTLKLAGGLQFYGMLLHLNLGGRDAANGDEACIQVLGTNNIYGGVVIEGQCGVYISGNARLTFSPNNLNFSVTGVAGLVQNTWRELAPGS